jgi:hypothetical protein
MNVRRAVDLNSSPEHAMPLRPCTTAVFDLTGTVAFVQLTADGRQIATLEVYSDAVEEMRNLKAEGVRVSLMFRCGQVPEDRVRARLLSTELEEFAEDLLVVPRGADVREAFRAAAWLLRRDEGCKDAPLLYIGSDLRERKAARRAGFKTVPHVALAHGALFGGGPLRYLRIRFPVESAQAEWIPALAEQPLVPIHITSEPTGAGAVIYAVADTRTAAALDDLGFWVDRLGAPGEPERTNVYLFRDDLQEKRGFLNPGGNASKLFARGPAALGVLASTHAGLLVALSGDTPAHSFHFAESRESHAQVLSPMLNHFRTAPIVATRATPLAETAAADPLSPEEKGILLRSFDPAGMKAAVARYAAVGSKYTGGVFGSRDFRHKGNKDAVDLLVAEFEKIVAEGFRVERHCFMDDGFPAENVVATLNPSTEMVGDGVVFVCAHLDSINIHGKPAKVEAPGADDDASGMAAVVAAARAFVELASVRTPHREVRFALFNCEEINKSGSQSYASAQAKLGLPVAAMFQIDMIGYNHEQGWIVNAHAGFKPQAIPNACVAEARSAELAVLIEHLRPITRLTATCIFTSPHDCGSGRSDQTMFHASGYPGCWVSENLFDQACEVLNKAWHTKRDTKIEEHYAAEIGRLVAAAAWIAATR